MTLPGRNWSRRTFLGAVGATAAAVFLNAGCGPGNRLRVFGASSLTEALSDVGRAFGADSREGPEFNFAASSVLATQIAEGAPADLFASADEVQMAHLLDSGKVSSSRIIAMNELAVVAGSGSGVRAWTDLASPDLRLVIAAPAVPVGRYTRDVLDRSALDAEFGSEFRDAVLSNVRSEELSARAVLAKVELGEADAGIVFATDSLVADADLATIAVPASVSVQAVYPAAVVTGSERAVIAGEFLDFVTSSEGQALLVARGFGPGVEPS